MDYTALIKDKAFVNGKWTSAASGKTFEVTNPANGAVLGSVPDMDQQDVVEAIKIAHQAFQTWKKTTAKERCAVLKKWYTLMIAEHENLAKLSTAEMGKPVAEGRGEVAYGAGFAEYFAEEAKRSYGDFIPSPVASKRLLAIRQPVGVVAMITPWNFPFATVTRKAAPALAAGCTVVIKPSEETPLSALAICELAEKAGIPPGVLNVVTCSRDNAAPVGKELCKNPLVAAVSFTGSSVVGKYILEESASTVKKVSLELGGNAPFIVFDTADLEKAVGGAMTSKFRAGGQSCVCANRIFVQEGIHDEFVEKLVAAIKGLKVGHGLEAGTTIGPLINVKAVEKVEAHIKDALAKGAKLIIGGKRDAMGEQFFEPTLLTGVTTEMICMHGETFGPVAPIIKFKTEEEVLSIANDCRHGLAGYFYSNNMSQLWRVAEELEVGMVGINEAVLHAVEAPFGGVKESGLGREGSRYGLDEYTEIKYLCFGAI
ncbi:succinate-semialdehyde dehydrogenase, mitochondrial-like [Lineus longissimus]|uniref:succinate-semialdehyde dehydrogenase, mitochondrial-like n=1 Tax=Lineus longissimus TaxID=88925 RepID=UPI002B4E2DE3